MKSTKKDVKIFYKKLNRLTNETVKFEKSVLNCAKPSFLLMRNTITSLSKDSRARLNYIT